ncbi:glycosyltransferase family 2 protein [Cellulomonas rhizosphaerae]|uniref:Glycosyltransferase family 2 protein n=1 Tax=Cellulomonas rhizosphaerae TaxID=2293719 RepID=A0A413RJS7_9CELL|nr:glycosyltransferase family 2 protein [Cellulomonas rhizosphaerae]RHA38907.1 glycosyltransferase family 2 protein [Cellulomonas rhizosphaerae]
MPAPRSTRPPVVVFATVRNEERDLRAAVGAVLAQDYPGPMVFALAVGPSDDATEAIAAELAAQDPRVVVVVNPTGLTPQGLNIATRAGIEAQPASTYLIRTDGHAELPVDYVRTAVDTLERTGADNVGGMMVPLGNGPMQEAVAYAMSHPVGLGGGRFHTGGTEGEAETVYLGAFRRAVFERLGGYDEHWSRAQDWELNLRLRTSGAVVWFTPRMRVEYRPRASFRALAAQFYKTGQWRREVVRRYPQTASPRYLAPPVAVVAIALSVVGAVLGVALGAPVLALLLVVPAVYLLAVVATAISAARDLRPAAVLRLPAVLSVMHMAWGSGFLRGR